MGELQYKGASNEACLYGGFTFDLRDEQLVKLGFFRERAAYAQRFIMHHGPLSYLVVSHPLSASGR